MVWALDVTHSWALIGVSVREIGEWAGGLTWSSLPLSAVVIRVGNLLRLVVGVRSRVRHLLGARGAGMARGCW